MAETFRLPRHSRLWHWSNRFCGRRYDINTQNNQKGPIHVASGFAGLAFTLFLGKNKKRAPKPHNLTVLDPPLCIEKKKQSGIQKKQSGIQIEFCMLGEIFVCWDEIFVCWNLRPGVRYMLNISSPVDIGKQLPHQANSGKRPFADLFFSTRSQWDGGIVGGRAFAIWTKFRWVDHLAVNVRMKSLSTVEALYRSFSGQACCTM